MSAPNNKEFLRQYNFAFAKSKVFQEIIDLLDENILSGKIKQINESKEFKGLIDDDILWHLEKAKKN